MARRRCHLHIDLAGLTGNTLARTLVAHDEALRDLGHKVPFRSTQEAGVAVVEMRRTHAEHGLRRRQVEGAWAEICRRAWKGKRVALMSVPGFGACTPEQVALVLDRLAGLQVTVLVSVPAVAEPEVQARVRDTVETWRRALRHGRVLLQPVRHDHDWQPVVDAFTDVAGLEFPDAGHRPLPLGA